MKPWFSTIILFSIMLLNLACEKQITESTETPKEMVWEKVNEIGSMDVRSLKVIDDVLYVAGAGDSSQAIFKTHDGITWEKIIITDRVDLKSGVSALTSQNNDIYVSPFYSFNKPVYKISPDGTVKPVTPPIPIEVSDIEILGNKLIVAPNWRTQYDLGVCEINGQLKLFKDSLAVDFSTLECYRRNGIMNIAVSKILKTKYDDNVLLGHQLGQFVTKFNTSSGFDCFNYKGLLRDEIMSGVYDLIWYHDTLLAATQSCVKKYSGNEWKVFGGYLPTKNNQFPSATSITINGDKVFVSTSFDGVLENNSSSWKELNQGLPVYPNGYYPPISKIVYFNGRLFIGYGTANFPSTGIMGLYTYKLTN